MPSSQPKLHSVHLAEYNPVAASEKEDRKGWVSYGDDNLFPDYLITLAETSPVHGALVITIAQMIAGSGITGVDESIFEKRLINNTAMDEKQFGGFYWEIIWNKGQTEPVKINLLPFENMRIAVNEEGDVIGAYFSHDWGNIRKKKNTPRFIPLFRKDTPEAERITQVYISWVNKRGSQYYGRPDYWSAVNYIELNRQIGMYHVNNILNGLFASFIISFFNGEPDPEKKAEMMRAWEGSLSGARNAGKFIALFNEPGVEKPDITTFPISDADKQYQFLDATSTQHVMIGHRATSPLLFGIRESGGGLGSNSDEIKQSYGLFKLQVIKPFQEVITDALEDILGVQAEIQEFNPFAEIQVEAPPAPPVTTLSEKKKPELTPEVEKNLTEYLMEVGEDKDPDWIEIDSHEVDYEEEINLVSTGKALPNAKSSQDKRINGILYITRYRYDGEVRDNTRPFCRKMISAGKLYRKEDIMTMKDEAVNPGWGPRGADTYSVWLYKGGGNCHHVWKKVVYVSAKDLGIDVYSPNAKQLAVDKAAEKGYKTRNTPKVAQRPIDMPNNGFLPKD